MWTGTAIAHLSWTLRSSLAERPSSSSATTRAWGTRKILAKVSRSDTSHPHPTPLHPHPTPLIPLPLMVLEATTTKLYGNTRWHWQVVRPFARDRNNGPCYSCGLCDHAFGKITLPIQRDLARAAAWPVKCPIWCGFTHKIVFRPGCTHTLHPVYHKLLYASTASRACDVVVLRYPSCKSIYNELLRMLLYVRSYTRENDNLNCCPVHTTHPVYLRQALHQPHILQIFHDESAPFQVSVRHLFHCVWTAENNIIVRTNISVQLGQCQP